MRKSIEDVFINELQFMLSAEEQIFEALPLMTNIAESLELKEAIKLHTKETKMQIKRLEQIFKALRIQPKAQTCRITQTLIEESKHSLQKLDKSPVRDAALIGKLQCVEHFEIAAYGTLRSFAKELGLNEAEDLLQDTLEEEANADKKLTKIAEGGLFKQGINRQANALTKNNKQGREASEGRLIKGRASQSKPASLNRKPVLTSKKSSSETKKSRSPTARKAPTTARKAPLSKKAPGSSLRSTSRSTKKTSITSRKSPRATVRK